MAEWKGKTGRWITTDNGNHVFVEDGKSVEEALAERFDEEYVADAPDYNGEFTFDDEPSIPEESTAEPETVKRNLRDMTWKDVNELSFDEILENAPQKELKEKFIKGLRGKLKSYTNESSFTQKLVKERFKKQLASLDVQDEQLFSIINDNVLNGELFQYIRVKSANVGGSTTMHWDRDGECRVRLNASPTSGAETMSDAFHELGHCLDYMSMGDHYSSTFISQKYNDSLTNVLKNEMQGVAEDIVKEIKSLKSQIPCVSKYTAETENYVKYQKLQTYRSLEDMLQSSMGDDRVDNKEGIYMGHKREYFEGDNGLHRGTEFFAELTDNIINDKNKTLLNICKKYLPKTTDIYFEILEEKFGYGRK